MNVQMKSYQMVYNIWGSPLLSVVFWKSKSVASLILALILKILGRKYEYHPSWINWILDFVNLTLRVRFESDCMHVIRSDNKKVQCDKLSYNYNTDMK